MNRFSLKHGSSLLAIACLLALAPAFAQDRAKSEVKSTNKNNSDRVKEQTQSEKGQAHPDQVAIPECLRKLNLSAQQQDQVEEIVQSYDGSVGMVWKQFSDAYMKTICLETGAFVIGISATSRRRCGSSGAWGRGRSAP